MNRSVGYLLIALIVITVVGSALTVQAIDEKAKSMRGEMIAQSNLAALSINVSQLQALSGTSADIGSSDYKNLKQLLIDERKAMPDARFVYIVGQWPNGTYFIYVDSEPISSPDYSPPGQEYTEASDTFSQSFSGDTSLNGPLTDRWGTWMTAMVPLRDPVTEEVVAVLGTDMDASSWGAQTAIAGAPEALASILLGTLMVIFFIMRKRKYREEQQLEKANKAQRDSEKKYRHLIENSHDIIYTLTKEGTFTFVSSSWTALLGHPVDQVVGTSFQHFVHEDDLPECMEFLRKALETGQRQTGIEYRVHHVNGSWRWHTSNGVPLLDEAGAVVGIEGIASDITERKRAEKALNDSEKRYRTLVDSADEAIVVAQDGMLRFVNPATMKMIGASEEELTSTPFPVFIHPDDRSMVVANYQKRSRGEEVPSRYVFRLMIKDGTTRWVEMNAVAIEWGGRPANLNFLTDITERKKVEESLQESEEKFRDIFNNANDAIHLHEWTEDGIPGRYIDINEVACRMLGYTSKEFLEMQPLDIATDFHNPPLDRVLEQLRSQGWAKFETRHRRKDGSIVPVEINSHMVIMKGRKITIAVVRDITDRKRTEEALQLISNRLELATQAGGVGIWDFDIVNNELTWDDQMFRLYGIQREQFSGVYEAWRAGLLPEDEQRGDKEIQMALIGEKEFDTEFRVRWPDGSIRNIRALALVQRDTSGRPLRMIGTNWDITKQKDAEEALRQSTERFKQLAEIFPETIFEADMGGKVTYANEHGLKLFGLDESEIAKEVRIFDLIAPSDKEKVISRLSERLGGMKGDYLEYLAMRRNGMPFNALAYTVPIMREGRPIGIRGFILDISQRKQMEEALRQNEESLRLVVTSAPFPLLITDRDGTYIIDANRQALAAFGLELSKGHLLAEIFIENAGLKEVMKIIDEKGSIDDMEISVRTQGGEHRWAILSARPMSYQGEERLLLATYDITDRRRIERALKQANAKLGIMNSITRHDMLNQMTALNGFLELCKMREKDPNLISYFDRMSHAAGNVQKQIAFTKDYQDMGVKAPAWASVGRQTADAFAMLHPKGVELEDATDGVEVMVDHLAEKVPYNLIDNSIRHGGSVTHIKMSAVQVGDAMMIVYEDDGEGISALDREHLFEKGFGKNTGLGLFLIREILAITDITIEEKGRPGQGVRFEMLVPSGGWRRPSQ